LRRPEVRRAVARIRRDYQPKKKGTLIIFTLSTEERLLATPFCKHILQQGGEDHQLLYLSPIYRLIPIELAEIYPLSQTLHPTSLHNLPAKTLLREAKRIIEKGGYKQIIAVCLNKHLHTKLTKLANRLNIKLLDYCRRGSKGQIEAAEEVLHVLCRS